MCKIQTKTNQIRGANNMETNFSFNFEANTTASAPVRDKSAGQVATYMKIVKQKRLQPVNLAGLNYQQMSDLIAEAIAFNPASLGQIELIGKLLVDAGMSIPTEDFYEKLTFAQASNAIQELQSIISEIAPPTDVQLASICKMFYCPDVRWEAYSIEIKVMLDTYNMRHKRDALSNLLFNEDGSPVMEEVQQWRYVTAEEFVTQVKEKFRKNDASKFLDAHRIAFEDWRKDRVSDRTKTMIRQIEDRIANIYVPIQVERKVDIEGKEVTDDKTDDSDVSEDSGVSNMAKKASWYAPRAYEPLSDAALLQFTQKEADIYLNRLRDEYARGASLGNQPATIDERKHGLVNYSLTNMDLVESTRTARTQADFNAKEWENLNNILYALCKVSGEDDMELINSGFYIFSSDQSGMSTEEAITATMDKRGYIRGYMMHCLESNFITMDGLLQMVDRCEIAKEILFGLNKVGKFVVTPSLEEIRDSRKRESSIYGGAGIPTYSECK